MWRSFLLFGFLFLVSGCSHTKPHYTHKKEQTKPLPLKPSVQKELPPYRLHKKNPITLALYDQYVKWYGVKYCYGGENRDGIDCSALVQQVYKDAFGISVPRTTLYQAKVGYFVKKRRLKEGDLVLFKTGYNSRHSGIYLERGNFLHSSSSHGVTISNINNPYWRARYWQSRRVIPQ